VIGIGFRCPEVVSSVRREVVSEAPRPFI